MGKIILASKSPRRREMLDLFKTDYEVIVPEIDEVLDKTYDPIVEAMSICFRKATSVVSKAEKGDVIIASDTIVVYGDEVLGKPKSHEEACNTLRKLSGKLHRTISAVAVVEAGTNKKVVDYEVTEVKFKDLTDEDIVKYVNTGEPMDKAGSYGIQGIGQILIESISGSYSNVVGLPIVKLDDILKGYFDKKIF